MTRPSLSLIALIVITCLFATTPASLAADPAAIVTAKSTGCDVKVDPDSGELHVSWQIRPETTATLTFDAREGQPLIKTIAIASGSGSAKKTLLHGLDPILSLTVGTRVAPPGRPPEMSIWNTFFDNPAKRPYETFPAARTGKAWKIEDALEKAEDTRRVVVRGPEIKAGSFTGQWQFTFFQNCPLVKLEAVMTTEQDERAYIFDLGLAGEHSGWKNFAWTDTEGKRQHSAADESTGDTPMAVRHRMLACEGESGSLAIFPPPHQFFFPVDSTNNNKFLWRGRGHQGEKRFAFGIRQDPKGGGNFVPWFNAPPGTKQRISMFLLVDDGACSHALDEALRYTRSDRFADMPDMTTYTSHYHMAITMAAMDQIKKGLNPRPIPELVKIFKDMNVRAVHLGEFHGDGHAQDPGPLRLPEMKQMFAECARLSDDRLLIIPGEEANTHLGIPFPGRHPGHWMLLFPKPVTWTMVRGEGQPFEEDIAPYGKVYHVGSRDDMVNLIKQEHGLAWTAHARIKASNWTPDIFKNEDFYKDDLWLGAAWKAMPADLSRERLGDRCLDLLSDMDNWGQKKYLPGEVDVFKIDHTHELYGHMNINYLRLPRMPRYEEGWQPILDTLRRGAFFTTTGEILIREFVVNGKQSGETARLQPDGKDTVQIALMWTFPLAFAELVSGDGQKVYRQRIDLSHKPQFGTDLFWIKADLKNRRWIRLEVWDVATNGAYTQPVWLE